MYNLLYWHFFENKPSTRSLKLGFPASCAWPQPKPTPNLSVKPSIWQEKPLVECESPLPDNQNCYLEICFGLVSFDLPLGQQNIFRKCIWCRDAFCCCSVCWRKHSRTSEVCFLSGTYMAFQTSLKLVPGSFVSLHIGLSVWAVCQIHFLLCWCELGSKWFNAKW